MRARSGRQVDAVLFDMGGVLLEWDPVRLYERLLGDPAAAAALIDEIDLHHWNDRVDLGEPYDEVIPKWQAAHPQRAEEIAAYRDRWADALTGPVPGVAEIIDTLRTAGVAVSLLSNTSAETFPLCREVAPVLDRLDGIVLSATEGIAKPDRRIYELALDRFGLEAARTAFVDDRRRNVTAAAELGLHAVAFTDAATLRRDLRALGLPL